MKLIKQPPDFYFFFFFFFFQAVYLGCARDCELLFSDAVTVCVCVAAHKGIISCSFLLKSSAGEKDNSASSVNRLRTFSIREYLAACC